MNFKSDNEAPAHPRLIEAIVAANSGFATAYSDDHWSGQLDAVFSEHFETACQVVPLATGTAANSIALASIVPEWGAILCHRQAHIENDEGGAPEFYTHGAKLLTLDGDNGKLCPQRLADAIDSSGSHGVHNVKPALVSITQATECGTSYRPDEIGAIAEAAHARGLAVHMDGARFANAVSFLGVSPAKASWQSGVDVLSWGATKNGALTAEALVIFGHPEWLEGMHRRRKRGGHLLSKMRYVSAQLLAMLADDLWLELAANANRQAARLAQAIERHPEARLEWPVEANEVFMRLAPERLAELRQQGFEFHIWPGHEDLARLVCSFATSDQDTGQLIDALQRPT
ncbi:MAG: low specificity L-threonine aldolase [Xanthomonadaceae bacterium]|nr:low specificity L-threonine aldolase [Xanthomonadaceae bacterium]